jgi:hypothetical protein
VWVVDADGRKRGGTLWWIDGDSARIRVDTGLAVLPIAARGKQWDFVDRQGSVDSQAEAPDK